MQNVRFPFLCILSNISYDIFNGEFNGIIIFLSKRSTSYRKMGLKNIILFKTFLFYGIYFSAKQSLSILFKKRYIYNINNIF